MICKRCERAYDYLTADYLCEDCDELLRLRISNAAMKHELSGLRNGTNTTYAELSALHEVALKELATEREKVGKLREGLKKLEWCYRAPGISCHRHFFALTCLACGGMHPATPEYERIEGHYLGHKPDCWLAALLEETK